MSPLAEILSCILCRGRIGTHNIFSRKNKCKMSRIATSSIIAEMIHNWNVRAFSHRKWLYEPRIHESVDIHRSLMITDISVAFVVGTALPDPTACFLVKVDHLKDSSCSIWSDIFNFEHIVRGFHMRIIRPFLFLVKGSSGVEGESILEAGL